MILIGVGLLLLAWFIYRKFVMIPTHPTQCEMRCEDGVCFPSCSPSSILEDTTNTEVISLSNQQTELLSSEVNNVDNTISEENTKKEQ